MFMAIGGMLVVVALFFLIFVEEGGFGTGLFLLGIAALLYGVSRVAPWLERRRALTAPTRHSSPGIVYDVSVHTFRSFLVFRNGVSFQKAGTKSLPTLVLSFTQRIGRFIIQPFAVVVTVPLGEEERAGRIVQQLGGNASEY